MRDIFLSSKNRQPNRLNCLNRRLHQAQHYIEIVNHQVQNHPNISGSAREGTKSLAQNQLGLKRSIRQVFKYRVEALDMAHLENRLTLLSHIDQLIRLGQVQCQRFFNEERYALTKEIQCDGIMMTCGHGNYGRVDLGD